MVLIARKQPTAANAPESSSSSSPSEERMHLQKAAAYMSDHIHEINLSSSMKQNQQILIHTFCSEYLILYNIQLFRVQSYKCNK